MTWSNSSPFASRGVSSGMLSKALSCASAGSTSSSGTIRATSPSSRREPPGLVVGLAQQRALVDLPEQRLGRADAVRERTLDLRRDRVEQRQRELHDLARDAVGVAELLDLGLAAAREVRQHLVPARVRDRPGPLGDVAEDRQRALARAARDHPQLHRREILRLVDDHVVVGAGGLADERVRLVQQRHVPLAPAGAAAAQQPLLVLVEDPVGGLGQKGRCREEAHARASRA